MTDLETLIQQTTNESFTDDNWRLIMEVCDEVSASPEQNTKVAIKAIKARLSLKDANAILRTLTLLVALGENCGSRMQQEIASTPFLQDYLLSKLADRNLHKLLRTSIIETIAKLDNSFRNDPSLKPVSEAYDIVRTQYRQYLPEKEIALYPKNKKEPPEEYQWESMSQAIQLSEEAYEREQVVRQAYISKKPLPKAGSSQTQPQQEQQSQQNDQSQLRKQQNQNQKLVQLQLQENRSQLKLVAKDSTASISTVKKVCALYDLISYEQDELSFRKGDIITVIESVYRDWWRGSLPNGKVGIFPLNYVRPVVSKTPQELEREEQIELDLINVHARNVDKLLALLSSQPDPRAEEEITQLYNSIIPHKATIAKLIESYSARKDELRVLNDQLSHEANSYNEMLDDLVSLKQKVATSVTAPALGSTGSTLPYPSSHPQFDQSHSQFKGLPVQDSSISQFESSRPQHYMSSDSRLTQQSTGYSATPSSQPPVYPPENYYLSQNSQPPYLQERY